MQIQSLLTALVLLAGPASGQILGVVLKDAKAAKSFEDHVVTLNGEPVVVGEAKEGIRYDAVKRLVTYSSNGRNVLFVADPGKPEEVPYKVKEGARVERSKKHVVAIDGADIARVMVLMADESLAGLAKEYGLRVRQIEELREARDDLDKTTVAWAGTHVKLVSTMSRLESWLLRTGFAQAATSLGKDREKLEKRVRDDALRARAEQAFASVHQIDPPEELVALAQQVSGGSDTFLALESQHLRVYFVDELSAGEMTAVLRFGEEVIEGFRAEFVDAYLAEDYPDTIPDGLFCEWFYVPNVDARYEAYTKGFYKVNWDQNREERLAMGGGRSDGGASRPYRFYRKNRDLDLEAIFCHDLGHALAGVHYGGDRLAIRQDWLSEGVAYYLSFEFLARNGVTCKSFDAERAGYVHREHMRESGEKTVGVARRDLYNEVALKAGRPIDQLALRDLVVMDDADLAKSWSFFDYVARKEGEAGQRWLRAAGQHAWDPKTFIANWRQGAAEVLEVDPSRAFKDIEERWKEFATMLQDTGETTRKRR